MIFVALIESFAHTDSVVVGWALAAVLAVILIGWDVLAVTDRGERPRRVLLMAAAPLGVVFVALVLVRFVVIAT